MVHGIVKFNMSENFSLSMRSFILLTSSLACGTDKSTIKRFLPEYFPVAINGLMRKLLNGGCEQGPMTYPLFTSFS